MDNYLVDLILSATGLTLTSYLLKELSKLHCTLDLYLFTIPYYAFIWCTSCTVRTPFRHNVLYMYYLVYRLVPSTVKGMPLAGCVL